MCAALRQVVEYALENGADILDVDGHNEPIFTEEAKRQWLKDVTEDLRRAISNPYEKPHEDPAFAVRWRRCERDVCRLSAPMAHACAACVQDPRTQEAINFVFQDTLKCTLYMRLFLWVRRLTS